MKADRVANLLAASIILTIISGIIKYYNVTEKNRTVALITHTYEVIQEASDLLQLLLEAETSQRNYIITEDSAYLRTHLTTMPKIDRQVNTLLRLTADNPRQTTLLNQRVKPLVLSKKNELTKGLELHQSKNPSRVLAYIKSDSGRLSMENLRGTILELSDHEEELLEERTSRLERIYAVNDTIHYASFVLICLISGLALKVLIEKDKKNKTLLAAINETNHNLEIKVHERTVDLEKKTQLTEKLNRDLHENIEALQSFYEALHISNAKAEDTLKEIRDLYDHAPCGYHSLDATGLIVRMNQTELNWLGYTRDEVIGKMNITQVLIPEEHKTYQGNFEAFKTNGYIRNMEHTFVRKDRSTFQTLINATAIYDTDGKYVMSRGSVTDISEQKAIELKLTEANQTLIDLNEERNHFLGVVIHDLKSPVNSILGLINLVQSNGGGNLNAEQQKYLTLVKQSCISMETLIANLLDINKIEQGLSVINPVNVNLSSLLERQVQIFNEQALRKGITLHFNDNLPGKIIYTDPAILQRILENLISNAIKFSPHGKEVLVAVHHNETHVLIEVADQGSGIKSEEMSMLFRKFQKLSSQPTGGENSTGLGLSIAKELSATLNGNISVKSEVNKGTTFIVQLPINP